MKKWPYIALLFALAGNVCGEPAASWPMFRGTQDLAGVMQDKLPMALELKWTYKTNGPVKSSAAIVGKQVFVGSDDHWLHAIDFATGKMLWVFKTEAAVESSPLILDNVVYFGSADGNLYAVKAQDGMELWRYKTGDKILGGANWLQTAKGKLIVFGSYDMKLHAVDAATGKGAWTFETGNFINGTPAVADGKIVFGGCDGSLHVVSPEGKKIAEIEAGAYVAGSVALREKRAYFGHYGNEVVCMDMDAGKIAWSFKERAFPFFSSPTVTDKFVVIGGRDKYLHGLDRATGKSVWEFRTRGNIDSSPLVSGDKVIVGSADGKIYLVNLADGKELWSYEIGKPITASPAAANGVIVIGSEDGSVYAFGSKGN